MHKTDKEWMLVGACIASCEIAEKVVCSIFSEVSTRNGIEALQKKNRGEEYDKNSLFSMVRKAGVELNGKNAIDAIIEAVKCDSIKRDSEAVAYRDRLEREGFIKAAIEAGTKAYLESKDI